MLSRLTIENYALIDHLDISFPGDLVIITGETGAGKSILLGALSLLLGGKADSGVLKDSLKNCVVEAQFNEPDGKETIIRRVLSSNGRSRAFIDDSPVTLEELGKKSASLVDIHSQHQHLLLSDRKFQISVLDSFAGLSEKVELYAQEYDRYLAACKRLDALKARLSASQKEQEYLEYQYSRLEEAKIKEGELEQLENEQLQLANSESIHENLSIVSSLLEEEEINVLGELREVESALGKIKQFMPESENLAARVDGARIELKDILEEVERLASGVVSNPQRLCEVEERLSLLYDLMRKHGVSSLEELIKVRDDLSAKLGIGVDTELEMSRLTAEVASLEKSCREKAAEIHSIRLSRAPEFSCNITEAVRSLEMPLAQFEIRVEEKETFGRDGYDDILFFFNANGNQLRELSKCASGGELSRIMLCLKSLMCKYIGMPTVIFDEIDTGVSGTVADKMGQIIVGMGASMQVVAITHLPQVASKGSAHYLVYKEGNPMPVTNIRRIEGDEREREIARMLSGASVTQEAIANARVLLKGK